MEYKKTYKGLILFFATLCLILIGGAMLFGIYLPMHMSRFTVCCISASMAVLTYIIYKTQNIYWYNNISYEEAERAGEKRRKVFALTHLKLFGILFICQIVFSAAMALLRASQWVDFTAGSLALCIVAIYTVKIKL